MSIARVGYERAPYLSSQMLWQLLAEPLRSCDAQFDKPVAHRSRFAVPAQFNLPGQGRISGSGTTETG